jgi:hypothetical protein
MTRIMFTGPHGIGKSASAIKLNRILPDYLYIPSFGGTVAKRMGFDLNKPHTTEQLIAYQERTLEVFIESFKATSLVDTIYDRSPNDIAAYMKTGLAGKYPSILAAFEQRCLAATRKYCTFLVYPEADLTEPMQNKHNRPTGDKYARTEFDKIIDYYVQRVADDINVIDVPSQYQYDDRVRYIYDRVKK